MAAALFGGLAALGNALAAVGAAAAAALASPVLLVVVAVVAIVCVAVVVYKNWDGISATVKKCYEGGKALVGAAATAIAGALDNTIKKAQLLFKIVALASIIVYTAPKTKKETNEISYTVYILMDDDENVQYVGRTKNPEDREKAHQRDPFRGHLRFVPIATGLTYQQARGYEQIMMLHCHTKNTADRMNNQINGISPKNKRLKMYMEAGRGIVEYNGNQISNEILNWMGK